MLNAIPHIPFLTTEGTEVYSQRKGGKLCAYLRFLCG
jgi:hypothetical protein